MSNQRHLRNYLLDRDYQLRHALLLVHLPLLVAVIARRTRRQDLDGKQQPTHVAEAFGPSSVDERQDEQVRLRIVSPHFIDREGKRLHA